MFLPWKQEGSSHPLLVIYPIPELCGTDSRTRQQDVNLASRLQTHLSSYECRHNPHHCVAFLEDAALIGQVADAFSKRFEDGFEIALPIII